MKISFLIVAIMNLIGCTMATGPKFQVMQADDKTSVVYIYRQAQFAGSANMLIPRLVVDGNTMGSMRMGGYYPLKLTPGNHTFAINATLGGKIGEKSFELKAGEIKYIEYSEVITGFKTYGTSTVADAKSFFQEVPPEYALPNLKKTKLLLNIE